MKYIIKVISHHGDFDTTYFHGKNESISPRPLNVEPYTYEKNAQKYIDMEMKTNEYIKTNYPDIANDYTYEIIAVPTQEEVDNAKGILAMYRELENTYV